MEHGKLDRYTVGPRTWVVHLQLLFDSSHGGDPKDTNQHQTLDMRAYIGCSKISAFLITTLTENRRIIFSWTKRYCRNENTMNHEARDGLSTASLSNVVYTSCIFVVWLTCILDNAQYTQ
ncbi:uncharacterized protein LOC122530871 isoform X2 [Frieseomelitta varia]|uniref:uncharacterized protein LOC122530871 isoform X2 n=1 Tax=Frieseomelitta varia TaxID=561572 RepID=UPI001CB6A312|nr:uncharacterized protein LOC122530871 isoform X2 [Frieseomelitta varia]